MSCTHEELRHNGSHVLFELGDRHVLQLVGLLVGVVGPEEQEDEGHLWAVSFASGEQLWHHAATPAGGVAAEPAVDDVTAPVIRSRRPETWEKLKVQLSSVESTEIIPH